jgi:hypothetical protein
VLGKPDFREAQLDRMRRKVRGIAHRVATESRVHVVVSGPTHIQEKLKVKR